MSSITPAVPTTGPTAALRINDPSTQYLIASGVTALVAVLGVFAANTDATRLAAIVAVAHLMAVVYTVLAAKHDLAATAMLIAEGLPTVAAELAPVLPVEVAAEVAAAADVIATGIVPPAPVADVLAAPVADALTTTVVDGPVVAAQVAAEVTAPTVPVTLAPVTTAAVGAVWSVVGADGVLLGTLPVDKAADIVPPVGP